MEGLPKRAQTKTEVTAEQVVTLRAGRLRPGDLTKLWACRLPGSRSKLIDPGADIYMVVGFHAITNARIIYGCVHGQDLKDQIAVSVGLLPEIGLNILLESRPVPSVG